MAGRKLRRPLTPAVDPKEQNAPQPTIEVPTDAGPQVKRGPGRPSKAEAEQKQAEIRAASAIKPEDMRPNTFVILSALCKVAKGDPPLEEEVDLVNPPATAVANKYMLTNKWGAELALIGSVAIVVSQARQRRSLREAVVARPVDRAEQAIPVASVVE